MANISWVRLDSSLQVEFHVLCILHCGTPDEGQGQEQQVET